MHRYSFEKLDVWQLSRTLTKRLYTLTNKYPSSEKFGLVSQIQRASISVCSNIAEGTSRSSYKEKARFSEIAYGSLIEILNQIIVSSDLGFISNQEEEQIRDHINEIANKLNKLRKSQLNRLNS